MVNICINILHIILLTSHERSIFLNYLQFLLMKIRTWNDGGRLGASQLKTG